MPGLELAAGFADHPVAHIHHQPELFQYRDKVPGRYQSTARVAPAQQGFGAGKAFAVAAELRLVIEHEFVLVQGVAQVAFQFQALQGAGVHVGLVELEVVFAALFSVIHRRVGVFHQLAQLVAVLRAEGDADTGGHEELAAFQHKGFDQAGEDLLGHMNGAVQRHIAADPWLEEQGEFVAAHARHGVVLGHTTEQARGHFLEHPVAGRVAEGVVDRLEAVQVEEHQHHPRLLPFGGLQRGVQAVLEQGAVGQVGQGVVVGQAVDALLTGLALADIAEETHVTGQVAFVVEHRGNADPGRVMLAIETLEPHLAFPGAVLVQLLEHITQMGFLLLIDGEHIGQLVEHIAHRIAADPAERLVGLHDITGWVGDQDRRSGMFEHRGCHAQIFFGASLLADIAAHAEDAFKRAMFIPHQHQAQFDRHFAPVGAQAVEQKQLGLDFIAQRVQGVGVAEGAADLFHQAVNAGQLLRVGNDRLPAVLEHPVHVIAQDGVDRGADVVEGQLAVGGADHVADAFGQHPVALFTVA